MNIAMICSDRGPCPPVKGGAIQLYIAKVAPILAREHQITVFSISDPSLPDWEIRDGVFYLRYNKSFFWNGVKAKLAEGAYDIIQIFNKPDQVAAIKQLSPQSKVILSLHNLIFATKYLSTEDAKSCLEHVDFITSVSRFVKAHLLEHFSFPSSRIRTVYSGVDLRDYPVGGSDKQLRWRSMIRKKWGIPQKAKVLLFAGRLVPNKGCHLVVNSLESVLKKHKNTYLLVVGSKWYAEEEKTPYIKLLLKKAKKLRPHVLFTSYVPVEQMPQYYAAADLFICASQWEEPLARVLYEAMAASLPIITTQRGGNPEVVEDGYNGYVLQKYRSPKALASKIKPILANPALAQRMGSNGRKLTENKYHFQRVAYELLHIYKEVVHQYG